MTPAPLHSTRFPYTTLFRSIMHASDGAIDSFVVRKAEKQHGMQQRIEGPSVAGRNVLVVEDVSTTGGSPLTAVEALREAGARDRKSTRLNSSHVAISYAVFC